MVIHLTVLETGIADTPTMNAPIESAIQDHVAVVALTAPNGSRNGANVGG